MKRPWMPFYVADYLADTAHLSTTEHGAYVLLILHYWTKGGLPSDEESIRRVTRLTPRQWSQSRDVLRSLFQDGWRHKRVDAELAQSIEKSKVNSANAKRRHSGRTEVAEVSQVRSDTQSQSQSQSQSEPQKKDPPPAPASGGKRAKRCPLPRDFAFTEEQQQIARAENIPLDQIAGHFAEFCAYWWADGRSKSGWNEVWRQRCRDLAKRQQPRKPEEAPEGFARKIVRYACKWWDPEREIYRDGIPEYVMEDDGSGDYPKPMKNWGSLRWSAGSA